MFIKNVARPTSSTQSCALLCFWILWSRSPPLQNSITIHRRSSAVQTKHTKCDYIGYTAIQTIITVCDKGPKCPIIGFIGMLCVWIPSNASLKATILGCFILDSRTASLLVFSNLECFYTNANEWMNSFTTMQSSLVGYQHLTKNISKPSTRLYTYSPDSHTAWKGLVSPYK